MSADLKPTDYLLNYLSVVPGTLEAVYQTVAAQGTVTLDQCRNLLFFRSEGDAAEDHVLRALNFLFANDVLNYDGTVYRAPYGEQTPYGFRALLIKGLHTQTDEQAHFMYIHELLVREGLVGIEVNQLLGFLNENKVVTVRRMAVNDLKLGFWMRMLDFLGVVRQVVRSKAISLTPAPGLLYHLVKETAAGKQTVSAQSFLEAVEKNYFPVTTRNGALHPGIGATIIRMRDEGLVDLTAISDATVVQISPTVPASHIILKEAGTDA